MKCSSNVLMFKLCLMHSEKDNNVWKKTCQTMYNRKWNSLDKPSPLLPSVNNSWSFKLVPHQIFKVRFRSNDVRGNYNAQQQYVLTTAMNGVQFDWRQKIYDVPLDIMLFLNTTTVSAHFIPVCPISHSVDLHIWMVSVEHIKVERRVKRWIHW